MFCGGGLHRGLVEGLRLLHHADRMVQAGWIGGGVVVVADVLRAAFPIRSFIPCMAQVAVQATGEHVLCAAGAEWVGGLVEI